MKKMLTLACACAVLSLTLSGGAAQAQTFNRTTFFTFSDTVMLPGMTLPPGTYMFSIVDDTISRRVVRVANQEGTHTYGLLMTVGAIRQVPTDEPELHFLEAPSGTPPPIAMWWYPGDTLGREFVYSDDEELRLAGRDPGVTITGTL